MPLGVNTTALPGQGAPTLGLFSEYLLSTQLGQSLTGMLPGLGVESGSSLALGQGPLSFYFSPEVQEALVQESARGQVRAPLTHPNERQVARGVSPQQAALRQNHGRTVAVRTEVSAARFDERGQQGVGRAQVIDTTSSPKVDAVQVRAAQEVEAVPTQVQSPSLVSSLFDKGSALLTGAYRTAQVATYRLAAAMTVGGGLTTLANVARAETLETDPLLAEPETMVAVPLAEVSSGVPLWGYVAVGTIVLALVGLAWLANSRSGNDGKVKKVKRVKPPRKEPAVGPLPAPKTSPLPRAEGRAKKERFPTIRAMGRGLRKLGQTEVRLSRFGRAEQESKPLAGMVSWVTVTSTASARQLVELLHTTDVVTDIEIGVSPEDRGEFTTLMGQLDPTATIFANPNALSFDERHRAIQDIRGAINRLEELTTSGDGSGSGSGQQGHSVVTELGQRMTNAARNHRAEDALDSVRTQMRNASVARAGSPISLEQIDAALDLAIAQVRENNQAQGALFETPDNTRGVPLVYARNLISEANLMGNDGNIARSTLRQTLLELYEDSDINADTDLANGSALVRESATRLNRNVSIVYDEAGRVGGQGDPVVADLLQLGIRGPAVGNVRKALEEIAGSSSVAISPAQNTALMESLSNLLDRLRYIREEFAEYSELVHGDRESARDNSRVRLEAALNELERDILVMRAFLTARQTPGISPTTRAVRSIGIQVPPFETVAPEPMPARGMRRPAEMSNEHLLRGVIGSYYQYILTIGENHPLREPVFVQLRILREQVLPVMRNLDADRTPEQWLNIVIMMQDAFTQLDTLIDQISAPTTAVPDGMTREFVNVTQAHRNLGELQSRAIVAERYLMAQRRVVRLYTSLEGIDADLYIAAGTRPAFIEMREAVLGFLESLNEAIATGALMQQRTVNAAFDTILDRVRASMIGIREANPGVSRRFEEVYEEEITVIQDELSNFVLPDAEDPAWNTTMEVAPQNFGEIPITPTDSGAGG